jgi:hypothetical protein
VKVNKRGPAKVEDEDVRINELDGQGTRAISVSAGDRGQLMIVWEIVVTGIKPIARWPEFMDNAWLAIIYV